MTRGLKCLQTHVLACGSVFPCDDDSEYVGRKKNDCLIWIQCDADEDDVDHDHCRCLCIGDDDSDLDLVLGEIL